MRQFRSIVQHRPRRVVLTVVGVAVAIAAATGTAIAVGSQAGGVTSTAGVPSAPSSAAMPSNAAMPSMNGTSAPPVATAGFPSGGRNPGIFTDTCQYSHSAADDPILAPNAPGEAMHHDFYGNTSTSAASTATTLVGGTSTCSTSADASAYWTPALYQNGTALTPKSALIYWRRPVGDTSAIQTVPAGLQLIAGNETATAPQARTVTAWTCSGQLDPAKSTSTPHDCPGNSELRLVVTFPSCWDGHTLTGAGQTNVVYRTASGCPASHPVQIPQIVFHVNYPTSSAAGLTVSMTPTMQGSTDTEHVDFINGWNEATVTADVAACDATSTRCGPVTGPDATPKGPNTTQRRPAAKAKMPTAPKTTMPTTMPSAPMGAMPTMTH